MHKKRKKNPFTEGKKEIPKEIDERNIHVITRWRSLKLYAKSAINIQVNVASDCNWFFRRSNSTKQPTSRIANNSEQVYNSHALRDDSKKYFSNFTY